jgi:hypothetical protein
MTLQKIDLIAFIFSIILYIYTIIDAVLFRDNGDLDLFILTNLGIFSVSLAVFWLVDLFFRKSEFIDSIGVDNLLPDTSSVYWRNIILGAAFVGPFTIILLFQFIKSSNYERNFYPGISVLVALSAKNYLIRLNNNR